MAKYCFTVLLLLFVWHSGKAEKYPSEHFTVREGLPSNTVRVIYKDSRDIIWLGTDAGLCTFDGRHIHRVALPDTLQSLRVWAITEDDSGHLWLGTHGGGLLRYDGREFSHIMAPEIISNEIRVLHYSHKHNSLLVGTQSGFSQLTHEGIFSWVPEEEAGRRFLVMGFIEARNGIIFHTFSHGAFLFNPHTKEVSPLPYDSPLQVSSSSATFITSGGDTLVGLHKNGLRLIGREGIKEFEDLGQVFDIKEDHHGVLWISVWSYYDMQEPGGLYTWDGSTLQRVGPRWNVKDRMSWSTLPDPHTGTVLVATHSEGMYKLIDRGISYFPAAHFGAERLEIYDLITHRGKLWVSAADRVIYGNTETGFNVLNEAFFANRKMYPTHRTDSAVIKPPGKFLALHTDMQQNLWIGSANALYKQIGNTPDFYRFNLGKRFSENFLVFPDGRAYSGAWSFFRIADNIFDSDHYTNKNYQYDFPVDVNRIIARDDEYWFASFTYGLYRYKNGQFKQYSRNQPSLPRNLSTLCVDGNNNLVAGTRNGRVLILKGSDFLRVQFDLNKMGATLGNEIFWLLCDDKNRLWVGSNMGVHVIDLNLLYNSEELNIRFFNENEGYHDFIVRTALQDEEGVIWLGGLDNLVRIEPEKFLYQPENMPGIALTEFEINFKKVQWDSIAPAHAWHNVPEGPVTLGYRQNHLTFRFSAPAHLDPEKVEYSFFLKGFSEELNTLGKRGELTFTNLEPGRYTLHLHARDLQSGMEYQPLQAHFRIRWPWYRTWYFYTTLVIMGAAILLLVMRLRVASVKKREQLKLIHEKKLNSIRIQAIQAQMNPHFVFNVLSSIQNFMLDNDMDSTLGYLNDFSALIRKTMENISEETIRLSEEIAYLKRYIKLEDLRLGNTIRCIIKIDEELKATRVRIPPMVVQPFVENAIKHGLAPLKEQRILLLCFRQVEQMLVVEIFDNGQGLHAANPNAGMQHKPAGIINTSERIRYFAQAKGGKNQDLYGVNLSNRTRNGNIKGVKVKICLPVIH